MQSGTIEFKKFKNEINPRNTKTRMIPTIDQEKEHTHQQINNPCIYTNNLMRSPLKKPTSFRQLSGSRDKNKLISGKKNTLENKLSTMRSNQKLVGFEIPSNQKSKEGMNDSGKKQGLFKKLLSSRSPNSIKKNLGFEDSHGSTLATNDSSAISFSAFKGIVLPGENQNTSNIVLQRHVSAGQQNQEKGLKFRNFPHKRTNVNNANAKTAKTRTHVSPSLYLNQGPLISEKGKSRSKSKNQKLPESQTKKSKLEFAAPSIINNPKLRKKSSNQNHQIYENSRDEYGLHFKHVNVNADQEDDQVIRSRQGSMAFDMSPMLL